MATQLLNTHSLTSRHAHTHIHIRSHTFTHVHTHPHTYRHRHRHTQTHRYIHCFKSYRNSHNTDYGHIDSRNTCHGHQQIFILLWIPLTCPRLQIILSTSLFQPTPITATVRRSTSLSFLILHWYTSLKELFLFLLKFFFSFHLFIFTIFYILYLSLCKQKFLLLFSFQTS